MSADSSRLDHSASGWNGAQDCHADITRAAWDHGQRRKKHTSWLSGRVRNVNDVATPKLPPPPPRQAQNRSLFWLAVQVRAWPSAVTIWTAWRLSLARPKARDSTPTPPPRVSPATPTVAQDPPGTARPRAASRWYMSMSRSPVPTWTDPPLTRKEFIAVTSTMSPLVLDQPA